MSHVATIDVEIRSLEDLRAACKRLGLEFVEGQETYRWYGRHVGDYPLPKGFEISDLGKCKHAIRIPLSTEGADLAYEIGVAARRDGGNGYVLLWDFFNSGKRIWKNYPDGTPSELRQDSAYNEGPGLNQYIGQGGGKLKQAYGTVTATRAARQQGLQVREVAGPNGSIRLVCSK